MMQLIGSVKKIRGLSFDTQNQAHYNGICFKWLPAEQRWPRLQTMKNKRPKRIAVILSPGIPIVSNGIIAEPATALLPDSAAVIPSSDPFPNFSGCLLHLPASL